MLRVAAIQLTVLPDSEQNLTSCLTLIERAVREHQAQLVVLPELANHALLHDDQEQARSVAVTLDGPFLSGLRAACVQHKLHLVVKVSLLVDEQLTSTGLLYGPDGSLLGRANRQILPSELLTCHQPGAGTPLVVQTEIGQLGLSVGRDAASSEQLRALALAGAQLVCAPFGPDSERNLAAQLSARASENRLFIVAARAACAVDSAENGPPAALDPRATWSHVVGTDGATLASAVTSADCLVVAELELSQAQDKQRPDGTDLLKLLRPDLYRSAVSRGRERTGESGGQPQAFQARTPEGAPRHLAAPLQVGLLSSVDAGSVEGAIESAGGFVRELAQQGVQLIVLPELFCFSGGQVDDAETAADWFQPAARCLAEACANSAAHVVTSLVERVAGGFCHVAVVIGHAGIVARVGQLHVPARHAWASPARRFEVLPLPWGKVGILVGEDAIVPEAARALARLGAELLIATLGTVEPRVSALSLVASALESGLPVAAAMRTTEAHGSFVVDPEQGPLASGASSDEAVLRATLRLTSRSSLQERPGRHGQAPSTAQLAPL